MFSKILVLIIIHGLNTETDIDASENFEVTVSAITLWDKETLKYFVNKLI